MWASNRRMRYQLAIELIILSIEYTLYFHDVRFLDCDGELVGLCQARELKRRSCLLIATIKEFFFYTAKGHHTVVNACAVMPRRLRVVTTISCTSNANLEFLVARQFVVQAQLGEVSNLDPLCAQEDAAFGSTGEVLGAVDAAVVLTRGLVEGHADPGADAWDVWDFANERNDAAAVVV